MNRQRGFITLDFLFAFVLVMGLAGLLFSVTITLTTVEITQYMTYASARNYLVSHKSEDKQRELASEKFAQLFSHPVVLPLFSNGWFKLDIPFVGINNDYQTHPIETYLFRGTNVSLTANMLDFNIPFFGSTSSDKTEDGGFRTTVGSYLGMEVPIDNCVQFTQFRWTWIKTLDSVYSGGTYPANSEGSYRLITDNGC